MSIQSSKLTPKQCCESNYIVIKDGEASGQPMHDIFGKCLSKSALIGNYFEEAYQLCLTFLATLKLRGLRAVEVSEIGLAIYNKSLVRYCNPAWSKPVILGRSPSQSQRICLVENTEDLLKNSQDIKVKMCG